MAVSDREIAAGRMTDDHSLRQLALTASVAPHLTHAELLAKQAKLQAGTPPAPKAPPSNASVSNAFGATLGKMLKGLLRR